MFALSGQGVLEDWYKKAGFRDVAVRAVPVRRHFPSTAEAIRAMKGSFPRLQDLMAKLSDADRRLAWSEIEQQLSQFEGSNGFEAPGEWLTGPSDAVTELANGADLFVTETSSCEDRKQAMINDGRWQVMTPAEQAGIMRQATQGHMTLDVIGKMATRANVKTVVLSHLTQRVGTDDYEPWAQEVKKHFSGQVLVAKDLMEF